MKTVEQVAKDSVSKYTVRTFLVQPNSWGYAVQLQHHCQWRLGISCFWCMQFAGSFCGACMCIATLQALLADRLPASMSSRMNPTCESGAVLPAFQQAQLAHHHAGQAPLAGGQAQLDEAHIPSLALASQQARQASKTTDARSKGKGGWFNTSKMALRLIGQREQAKRGDNTSMKLRVTSTYGGVGGASPRGSCAKASAMGASSFSSERPVSISSGKASPRGVGGHAPSEAHDPLGTQRHTTLGHQAWLRAPAGQSPYWYHSVSQAPRQTHHHLLETCLPHHLAASALRLMYVHLPWLVYVAPVALVCHHPDHQPRPACRCQATQCPQTTFCRRLRVCHEVPLHTKRLPNRTLLFSNYFR